MGKKDPRVDAAIAVAAPFARPILIHIRKLVHQGCPDVEETLKWRFPCFTYHGILCGMAGFKRHCTFGFWHKMMHDAFGDKNARAWQRKIMTVKDLPADKLFIKAVKQAAALNASGVKAPKKKIIKRPPPRLPEEFRKALQANARAQAAFDAFAPSHKREYVEWIAGAKRDETRATRIATALEWMADGKSRNWKYENC